MAESVECNSIERNSTENSNLDNQQFGLNKINEIKEYFIVEMKERELMSKRVSKYFASFGYFDKSLIALSATSGGICCIIYNCYWNTSRNSKCKS